MPLVRLFLCIAIILSMGACEFVKQNAGIDLQEAIEEGIASFEEPFSLGVDQEEDQYVSEAERNTSLQHSDRQPLVSQPLLTPEQKAIQTALVESAQAAERNFDYRLATMHYGRLVEMDPGDVASVLGFARNLRYSGNPKDSILLLKGVLASIPSNVALRIELVKAQIASGLIAEAMDNTDFLLSEAPGEWEVYALQGVLLDHAEKFDAAGSAYGQALSLSPNNIAVLNNMSLSLAQDGKLDSAINLLEGLVRSEYSVPQVRQNLALFYALRGDIDAAEELAKEDLPFNIVSENFSSFKVLNEK